MFRPLNNVASIDSTTPYSEAATKLERLDLTKTLGQTKADRLVRQLFDTININQDRMAAAGGIVRLVTDEEKVALQGALQDSAKHMPGMSYQMLRCFGDVTDRVRQNHRHTPISPSEVIIVAIVLLYDIVFAFVHLIQHHTH